MKSLYNLCKPRESVFNPIKREDVLDLTNLIDDSIDPQGFFEENYPTEGMKLLFESAFNRFLGKSEIGIIKLTQSMGGGKTHNMIALGLLAKFPFIREKVAGDYGNLGKINVIGFSGRESDAQFGIWGSLAEQLGKKSIFSPYFADGLSAPGMSAWINLLKGEPTLILLDELPPYLENAKSYSIGNSDLGVVTTNALANLFVAVGKRDLSNVCVVISDLKATYESGSELLQSTFKELENEVSRYALDIEPVGSTSDEVYHILRKRIFKELPTDNDITEIADEYKKIVKQAYEMDHTTIDPDNIYIGIKESYPFHPSIMDLYARFKENPGFQQTRGLIRLMRLIVSQLFKDNGEMAKNKYLIHPYDIDLHDREMLSIIAQIKPSLTNAISHDISKEDKTSVAETIDRQVQTDRAQDISKLFLIASLANVPNAILGLSIQEAVGYLCEPNKDVKQIKKLFADIVANAWYLHTDRDDNFFYKDTKNIIAQLNSLVSSYNNDTAKKEIKVFLENKFKSKLKDCYQEVIVFPAIDEINPQPDKLLLILAEPYIQGGINPDLNNFYNDTTYKNRIMFLSGQRNTMDNLLRTAKEYKAITKIMNDLKEEHLSEKDSQYEIAANKLDKVQLNFLQAARETFITIYYPWKDKMLNADFLMQFKNNDFNGEEQIKKVLLDKWKFTEDINSENFRKKVEDKLFTRKEMPWNEVKNRAATDPSWLLYIPRALDDLKDDMIKKEIWKETGSNYIEKGPFPKEKTSVQVQVKNRNEETGITVIKIIPINADTVYYEIDTPATISSGRIEDLNEFQADDVNYYFLAVDSTKEHETGAPINWKNEIILRYKFYDKNNIKMLELKAIPDSQIRYTTDGSNPAENGGIYTDTLEIPDGTIMVCAVAEKKGIYSLKEEIPVPKGTLDTIEIDDQKPLKLIKRDKIDSTRDVHTFLERIKKLNVQFANFSIYINLKDESTKQKWVEISFSEDITVAVDFIEKQIDSLRENIFEGTIVNIVLSWKVLHFPSGRVFRDWIAESRKNLKDFKRSELIQ